MMSTLTARRIGIGEALLRINGQNANEWTCPGDWLGRQMFFANDGELYRVPFSIRDWRIEPGGGMALSAPGIESVRTTVALQDHSAVVFSQGDTTRSMSGGTRWFG
jgi:hypothetical protein